MMLRPGKLNLEMWQGATFEVTWTWWATDVTPMNLTGYTAHAQVRSAESDDLLIDLKDGAGITLGGALGTVKLAMAATDTATVPGGLGKWDIELTAPNAEVYRLLEGSFTIYPEVTR